MTDMTAAVLAGGLGTRLRPALDDRPKVLALVAGRPFLTYLLDMLRAVSVKRVVLLTGYKGEQVESALGHYYQGMSLVYSAEPSPRGTAGALRVALPHLDSSTILLLNGDSYCGMDMHTFAGFHRRRGADVSIALTRVEDAGRYGRVETTAGGLVTAFAEKQPAGGPGWINAGVYLLERRVIEEIPTGRPVSLEREMLPAWIASKTVYGHRRARPFLDVGTPESYLAAAAFMQKVLRTPRPKVAMELLLKMGLP
jgi:D-glycero-alpha-D-manno-heptose 1-phosphate guanylyltransferase